MRFLNILLILIALTPFARADENNLNPLNTPSEAREFKKIELKEEITFDFWNTFPTNPNYQNYWSKTANEPKTYYQVEYVGFERLLLNRSKSFVNKYYRTWIKEYLNNSNNEFDYYKKLKVLENTDTFNKWNRNFWEYSSDSGSHDRIYTEGQDLELFNLANLHLYSSGKLRLEDLDITFADQNQRSLRLINQNLDQNFSKLDKLFLEVATPETSFLESYNIKIRAKIGFNIRTEMKENASSFKANVSFVIGKKPWGRILIKTETQPLRNQYSLQLSFELLRF